MMMQCLIARSMSGLLAKFVGHFVQHSDLSSDFSISTYTKEMWGQKNDSTFFLNERIYICKAEFFNLSFNLKLFQIKPRITLTLTLTF